MARVAGVSGPPHRASLTVRRKRKTATLTDEYLNLVGFAYNLLSSPGTNYFRGLKILCERRLGGHAWTVYEPKTNAFTTGIGRDEADYVAERLIYNGALAAEDSNPAA